MLENKLIESVLNYNQVAIKDINSSAIQLKTSQSECVFKAVELILKQKEKQEKIFIGGDYDCDGICATTIIKDALDKLGIENGYYIPNRFKEGYGLSPKIVQKAYEKGYTMILTVDNGVKAYEAIELAQKLGMAVLVTDHHLIETPLDILCVHPNYMEEDFQYCCGAAVALQLARHLVGNNDFHTALAGIASIADSMVVLKETRNIIKHALKILNQKQFPILNCFFLKDELITATEVAYTMVPIINSVGRLSDMFNPNDIIRYYFLCTDDKVIKETFMKMTQLNHYRKKQTQIMFEEALNNKEETPIICSASPNYHEGIVGIIAGRLVSFLKKPAIVLCEHEGILKGSGRSIAGFDLHGFLSKHFDSFLTFGGHQNAVGLSLEKKDYASFVKILEKANVQMAQEEAYCFVKEDDLKLENVQQLMCLEPFGVGFKLPDFAIENPLIEKFQLLKNRYPKYQLNNELNAIGFDQQLNKNILVPQLLVGQVSISSYQNKQSVLIALNHIE